MNALTIGKLRGFQQCATGRGGLAILALDHRNSLRYALHPGMPDSTTVAEMSAFKCQVTAALAPVASAVLLDPEIGGAQCITSGALPGKTGLVVALGKSGYTGDPTGRRSQVLAGWGADKAKRMGASAVKLLVYYHPDSTSAAVIESLVHRLAEDCARMDIPFFLEPLTYSLGPGEKNVRGAERRRVVLKTVRRLAIPGVDMLKVEFPIDITAEPDQRAWADACAELSETSPVPWVLLSAGVDYEVYLRQVTVACRNGASGVAVGRAVWKEATGLGTEDRERFLHRTARERMQRLTELVDAFGRPWTEFFSLPAVDATWFRNY